MRKAPALLSLLLLVALPRLAFGQDQNAALAASLAKEEQLLASTTPVGEGDVARMEQLVARIRQANDSALLPRAELLLVLFREQESSKAKIQAENRAIIEEAKTIRGYRWHRTKGVLVKVGFWTGLSSLAILGASQAVKDWATTRYLEATTVDAAKPYFVAGQVSQLTTAVGMVGALGGLGLAWLLEINPFDIPSPPATGTPTSFPRAGMSSSEKISYLDGMRKDYVKRQKRAAGLRTASVVFLAGGLTGVLATGITGYLGNLEYQKYTAAKSAADAASYHHAVTIYQDITIGTASLALVGLTGAMLGYLFGPDPGKYENSIKILDHQLQLLQGGG